jgi:hypothetical protein
MAVIAGVAVLGPGLPDWATARAVLAGEAPWQPGEVVLPPPAILSPTERRRTGPVARLALAVATAAAEASGLPPASLRPVFGSGNGDTVTVGGILEALTADDAFVSPTQFHNSVHNAAAGYWSIGTGCQWAATCIGAFDWTFGASLMKAVAECEAAGEPVLLCLYDVPMPPPLNAKRPTSSVFGAAFVLTPDGPGPRVSVGWSAEPARDPQPLTAALQPLAAGNAAAQSLRLLEILARGEDAVFDAALLDGCLSVTIKA